MRRILGYKDKLFFVRAFNGGFVQNINIINRTAKSIMTEHYPWTATILGHDEEIYSTEAATEIPIC